MAKAPFFVNSHDSRILFLYTCLIAFLFCSLPAFSQETESFDSIAARAELDDIDLRLNAEEVEAGYLNEARARVVAINAGAERCELDATAERARLEARFEPLRDVDADVASEVFDQRIDIRRMLDETVARQTRCAGIMDSGGQLIARITERQTAISQQFLSNRVTTVVGAIREIPARIKKLPARIRSSVDLQLVTGMTPLYLFWLLIGGGLLAAGLGIAIRQGFTRWFEAAGGASAAPQMKYLFPKPLAEYSPLILEGLALVTVLMIAIDGASLDLAVVRIAAAIMIFGVGCVVIDWATGPLSPSASVKGLIPDHVKPLRIRLRFFVLTLVASFAVLGTRWLAIRTVAPEVAGRATMIFLVAVSLLSVISYMGRIPGIRGRLRLIRYLGSITLLVGIVALLVGYHNFAGYLIHGVTRTTLSLFILWVLLWAVVTSFEALTSQDTPAARQLRSSLGITKRASRTGLGFMQLIADIVLWLSFLVYLIYVWDESGTTLKSLFDRVVQGVEIGNIRLIPKDVIGGILIFAALIIVIGWVKSWIDRRWLQQMDIERGAREALITLFGYVGFVVAVLIGLAQANVDLGGLAWVSAGLAIGIGFGMQEIANNFVSGLILLFERPIRTGDFVTVGDIDGFVRRIRIRATEIETLDNQNVMVPNSELISGRVTNWVLRDTHGRLRVTVGVAYGSDIEKVREILECVAQEHPEVITDGSAPAPRALFMSFGDSSLDFELRVRIHRIDRRFSVKSDLNFAIDQAFREAGVAIPFPQRDLHLISLPESQQPQDTPVEKEKVDTIQTRAGPQPDAITRSHHDEVELTASIEDVWQALTDIESLKQWLAQDGEFSSRIGGHYALTLRDGSEMSGRIDVFIPPRRMRLVVALRDGAEPLASGPITVQYLLRKHDDKVLLSVTVSGIPATEDWEEDYRRSEERWQTGLAELQDFLNRK